MDPGAAFVPAARRGGGQDWSRWPLGSEPVASRFEARSNAAPPAHTVLGASRRPSFPIPSPSPKPIACCVSPKLVLQGRYRSRQSHLFPGQPLRSCRLGLPSVLRPVPARGRTRGNFDSRELQFPACWPWQDARHLKPCSWDRDIRGFRSSRIQESLGLDRVREGVGNHPVPSELRDPIWSPRGDGVWHLHLRVGKGTGGI